jgi:hypothetical protein
MSIICEFEEDAFQQAVDIAISKITNVFTTPGRVSESILGYDAAFFINQSAHMLLLRKIAYRRSARYLRLNGVDITDDFFDDLSKLTKNPPKFKLNLFIQYKVPEKLVGNRAAQWSEWGGDYYRFSIREKQLKILCDLHARAAGRAIVCYASPAFNTSDTLEQFIEAGTIIENSNFVSPDYLSGHHFYTYQTALGIGLAHSEVSEVSPIDLKREISDSISQKEGKTIFEAITDVSEIILKTEWGSQIEGSAATPGFSRDFLDNIELIRKYERYSGTKLHLLG